VHSANSSRLRYSGSLKGADAAGERYQRVVDREVLGWIAQPYAVDRDLSLDARWLSYYKSGFCMVGPFIACPGCGALFPPHEGPTHRYVGASSACWELNLSLISGSPPDPGLLARSRVPPVTPVTCTRKDTRLLDAALVDAYGVQHHGEDSPQAIQSVALHLLALHGFIAKEIDGLWIRRRALRTRGVFHKLQPPLLGCALTIRHFFASEGTEGTISRSDYACSVHAAWIALHRATIEDWYERYVVSEKTS
jgi:hypothetical protein